MNISFHIQCSFATYIILLLEPNLEMQHLFLPWEHVLKLFGLGFRKHAIRSSCDSVMHSQKLPGQYTPEARDLSRGLDDKREFQKNILRSWIFGRFLGRVFTYEANLSHLRQLPPSGQHKASSSIANLPVLHREDPVSAKGSLRISHFSSEGPSVPTKT